MLALKHCRSQVDQYFGRVADDRGYGFETGSKPNNVLLVFFFAILCCYFVIIFIFHLN